MALPSDAIVLVDCRIFWYSQAMKLVNTPVLDRLLDPLARSLTLDDARALLELRADPDVQAHLDELADKCNEGTLTPEERAEYQSYVQAINLITLLQARARLLLAQPKTS
jgi:hypothetical protein